MDPTMFQLFFLAYLCTMAFKAWWFVNYDVYDCLLITYPLVVLIPGALIVYILYGRAVRAFENRKSKYDDVEQKYDRLAFEDAMRKKWLNVESQISSNEEIDKEQLTYLSSCVLTAITAASDGYHINKEK